MKKSLTALSLLFFFTVALIAAGPVVPKYGAPAPAIPKGKAGVITLDPVKVSTTRNADNTVLMNGGGMYNYDSANYFFGAIVMSGTYTQPGQAAVNTPSAVITDENSLPAGGNWSAVALIPINVANNTNFTMQAKLTLYEKIPDPNNQGQFIKGQPVTVDSTSLAGGITSRN